MADVGEVIARLRALHEAATGLPWTQQRVTLVWVGFDLCAMHYAMWVKATQAERLETGALRVVVDAAEKGGR